MYVGALDIGGTKIAASIATIDGLLFRISEPTAKTGTSRALGDQAVRLLDSVCDKAKIDRTLLRTLGVSSCGPFVYTEGLLELATPNICGRRSQSSDLPNDWETIPLERILRERFDHVAIENDCIAALTAERMFGVVQEKDNCVYATWSTGIGFGCCVDGHILRGKQGNAGHAGHMLMNERADAVCGCGNHGDVEALVSGRNLANSYGRSAPELFAAARNGDPVARSIAVEAAQWFGRALYNIAVMLDTHTFVIGGSVWSHHGNWLAPFVEAEITTRLPALTQGITIVPPQLEGLVADIGAFSLVMPTDWIEAWRKRKPWQTGERGAE